MITNGLIFCEKAFYDSLDALEEGKGVRGKGRNHIYAFNRISLIFSDIVLHNTNIYIVVCPTSYISKMVDDKKEKILKALRMLQRATTSQIAGMMTLNHRYAKKYLQELAKEGEVIEEQETNATYWKIKK